MHRLGRLGAVWAPELARRPAACAAGRRLLPKRARGRGGGERLALLPQPGAPQWRHFLSWTPGGRDDKRNAGAVPETKWVDTPFNASVFDLFKLVNFSKSELASAFDRIDTNKNGLVERSELDAYVRAACEKDDRERCMSDAQVQAFCDRFMRRFEAKDGSVSREQFDKVILSMANTVDRRVWPITASMVLTGTAIGTVIPVMPLFVKSLGLSTTDFGLVVSAFAFSKLIGNIPCAFLADKHGRKPVMTTGLALVAVGMGGIGFVDSLAGLVTCRLISGLGASAFTTASMLYLMDIGTPFTRTKTMAPISAGFSAGAAIGPAMGGFLASFLGLQASFVLVGGVFTALTFLNRAILTETLNPRERLQAEGGLSAELKQTIKQWRPLLQDGKFRSILGMNVMYWLALSGSYMTLLPMLLVREELALTPAQIGGVFAMASTVNVIATQPAAWLADRFGKPTAIVSSSLVVSGAMFAFPVMEELTPALAILALWSIGGTMFGMAPTAYVTDIVPAHHRSQALALLRTTGDVGLLLGASVTGVVADHTSKPVAMQSNAVALLGTGFWFGLLSRRQQQQQSGSGGGGGGAAPR